MSHSGGHLPFETEVTSKLLKGVPNRVTVAVNNTLTPTTLPPGTITYKNDTNRSVLFRCASYQYFSEEIV